MALPAQENDEKLVEESFEESNENTSESTSKINGATSGTNVENKWFAVDPKYILESKPTKSALKKALKNRGGKNLPIIIRGRQIVPELREFSEVTF